MNPTLFANEPAERAQAIDQRIVDLLYGGSGDLFGVCLDASQRAVLKAIRFHRGSSNPITIRDLREKTDLSERDVKDCIRALRLQFGLSIGASRNGASGGYFLILSDGDMALFKGSALRQVLSELEVVRAVCGDEAAKELLGQLVLALPPEARP